MWLTRLLAQLAVGLAVATSACSQPLAAGAPRVGSPPAAATFIAAHAYGGAAVPAAAVSPLYRAGSAPRLRARPDRDRRLRIRPRPLPRSPQALSGVRAGHDLARRPRPSGTRDLGR